MSNWNHEERQFSKRVSNAIYAELQSLGLSSQELKARGTAPIATALKQARAEIYREEAAAETNTPYTPKVVRVTPQPHLKIYITGPWQTNDENWHIDLRYVKNKIQSGNGMDSVIVERFAQQVGMQPFNVGKGIVGFELKFASFKELKQHFSICLKPESLACLDRDDKPGIQR